MGELDVEVWKTYPRCPHYEVSNAGRVRSKDRVVETKHGRSWLQKGRVLKPATNKNKRVSVRLSEDGKKWSVQVSHMVAETFIRLRSDRFDVVRHLNDDPSDNRLENLRIGTYSENAHDAVRNGRNVNSGKTHCKRGHPFTAWNTVPNTGVNGRACKACRNAKSFIRYPKNKGLDFQSVSDSYFEKFKKDFLNG